MTTDTTNLTDYLTTLPPERVPANQRLVDLATAPPANPGLSSRPPARPNTSPCTTWESTPTPSC